MNADPLQRERLFGFTLFLAELFVNITIKVRAECLLNIELDSRINCRVFMFPVCTVERTENVTTERCGEDACDDATVCK